MVTLTLDFSNLENFNAESNRMRLFLAKIETELEPKLQQLLLEHARMMRDWAREIVRVDTGTLRKSIRVEHVVSWGVEKHIAVRSGGYFVNPKTGRICDYAGWVEAQFPYMRPAYDRVKPLLEYRICLLTGEMVTL